ncbi:MAG: bifunctional UDP-N-acetylglucosamine diphosphorylase/glucosamine-1-phosphate N-acetyltransferase GlmU [Hyphomicrobiales bacterium]|nr:bifunctional UDP-N-acetylglucosamine diphosphorylase/glucosamine-1-phosphate N-acetyltransferase GlmU [Hyphomicrobiales bacterium]
MQASARRCLAIVLAAGEGTRMRSARPKVLHEIAGRSMLAHVLAAVGGAGAEDLALVIGPDRPDVAEAARKAAPNAEIFVQTQRLGTAHAVLAARAAIERGYDDILIAFADTPLIEADTFRALRGALDEGATVAVLGFEAASPDGYGRLVTDGQGGLLAIREHKDANDAERAITLCNAGLMAVAGAHALALLDAVQASNAQKEYYLTDIVAGARAGGLATAVRVAPEAEVQGVNDRLQLAACEATAQTRLRDRAMRGGATLIAPQTVWFNADTEIGRDVTIEPNVFFGPRVKIADNVTIRANSHLEGAKVAEGAIIGPYARLRPGAEIGRDAHIGNFVEVKASTIGAGAKANHLAYIGDASVGAKVNIGAGVITCNYDGFAKHRTEIGEGAFVGTNSSLVAPVRIGAGAYIGSGSVVTKNVADEALAVERSQQVEKPGWAARFRAAKSRK